MQRVTSKERKKRINLSSEVKLFSVGLADSPAGGASPKSGEKPQAHHEKDMTSQLMHHLQNLNK